MIVVAWDNGGALNSLRQVDNTYFYARSTK